MKLLSAAVVCLGVLLLASPQQSEAKAILAKLGLVGAPFVWAGNVAKDAAQTLVAYKLSLASKALAVITGDRSFKATFTYDSHLERSEEPHGTADEHHVDWSERVAAVTAAPNPGNVENEVKPVVQVPTFPPPPNVVVPTLPPVPNVVVPIVPTLPPLPNIIVPKVIVPRIVVPPIVVPDLVKTKVALLNRLGHKSASILGGVPKHASGYIQGGFRLGHGNGAAGSHSGDVKLGSGQQQVVPVTPAVGPRVTAPVIEDKNTTGQNASSNVPLHRPTRSADPGLMGRYFKVIEANDEGRCVALMVCSMAAAPQEFGAYGRKVVQFFEGVKASDSSPMAPYKRASMAGRSGDSCKSRYSTCRVNPKYLADLGEYRGF
ncbi:hypothetical protein V5799_004561 [Amblyomma americanum]|uniref:Uncharacterized protein n=1 Tax=Amblyomma americanum TaxID=6943 RepID=A0AAQ4D5R5_AMBAM